VRKPLDVGKLSAMSNGQRCQLRTLRNIDRAAAKALDR
jgi:hypothetical protein